MASREARSSLLFRDKIYLHLPIPECHNLFDQEFLRRPMQVVTHFAIPSLVSINVQLMQVSVTIPEIGSPICLLCIYYFGVMTHETEFKIFCLCRHIILFRVLLNQQ